MSPIKFKTVLRLEKLSKTTNEAPVQQHRIRQPPLIPHALLTHVFCVRTKLLAINTLHRHGCAFLRNHTYITN